MLCSYEHQLNQQFNVENYILVASAWSLGLSKSRVSVSSVQIILQPVPGQNNHVIFTHVDPYNWILTV